MVMVYYPTFHIQHIGISMHLYLIGKMISEKCCLKICLFILFGFIFTLLQFFV